MTGEVKKNDQQNPIQRDDAQMEQKISLGAKCHQVDQSRQGRTNQKIKSRLHKQEASGTTICKVLT